MGGQRHAPAALPPGKTRYPLYRRLGGPRDRFGRVRKISSTPGFDPVTILTVLHWITSPGVNGGRCVGLTTLTPSCADCLEILGASASWRSKGLSSCGFYVELKVVNSDSRRIGRESSAALYAVARNDLTGAVMRVVKHNNVLNMEHWRWETGYFFRSFW